jgi:type III restriction enzyme
MTPIALHPSFPESPYEIVPPALRVAPASPLVASVREQVFAWRASGYAGASETTRGLLRWWFETPPLSAQAGGALRPFRYYFAQREAVESVVWLYELGRVRVGADLSRFDAAGSLATDALTEAWPRFVIKMATGVGKTKVLSLLLAFSYFHRLYEPGSRLARNFLIVAPNIIVLDRLRTDFEGLRIFFEDAVLPEDGFLGRAWREDFQLAVHIQDDVRNLRPIGNVFLTNVHRLYLREECPPSLQSDDLRDYFFAPFGAKRSADKADLAAIVRGLDELAVLDDEAHHLHDAKLTWSQCVRDIHHRMLQGGSGLALQVDVTATPRHDDGKLFAQVVSDYPLVEAIAQRVVKQPVLPDLDSRARLQERESAIVTERYAEYLALGVELWRRSYALHARLGKKAVLFVMVDDTKNCDLVGAHLEASCPELRGAVLVIHTKSNGEISESAAAKSAQELERLRRLSNQIDSTSSPIKAIVSVLVLKEGWDVRNVTTIVGLRAFAARSNILAEQTLGRGLRRMYADSDARERVTIVGTAAFMDIVESIRAEGVDLAQLPATVREASAAVIEVDWYDPAKDLAALDIALPRLSPRFVREAPALVDLELSAFCPLPLTQEPLSQAAPWRWVFESSVAGEPDFVVCADDSDRVDARAVIGFVAGQLLRDARMLGGYAQLYPKLKAFVCERLFGRAFELDDPLLLHNLSQPAVCRALFDHVRAAIQASARCERASCVIDGYIRLRDTPAFRSDAPTGFVPRRSVFNRIVADSPRDAELTSRFAGFLDAAPDVQAFAKNYAAVGFALEYVDARGELSLYRPEFIVRTLDGSVWIVDLSRRGAPERARLRQWCRDASQAAPRTWYRCLWVEPERLAQAVPETFAELAASACAGQGS